MAQQTAVEWLHNKLNNVKPTQFCSIDTIKEWVEQAKQLEKEQIIEAHNNGKFILPPNENGEQYYNETYNTQNK